MIGNEDAAFDTLLGALYPYGGGRTAKLIGRGEARRVYLLDGVVYKIAARNSANEHEHQALTAWRLTGAEWAPETSLYRFQVDGADHVVLAMPYLPRTSTPDPAMVAEIRQAAPEVAEENITARRRRTWLIDGGDIENWPHSSPAMREMAGLAPYEIPDNNA